MECEDEHVYLAEIGEEMWTGSHFKTHSKYDLLCKIFAKFGTSTLLNYSDGLLRACLFRCKTSQVVSRKMRMEKVNCSRENILCFTVFG